MSLCKRGRVIIIDLLMTILIGIETAAKSAKYVSGVYVSLHNYNITCKYARMP